MRTKKREVVVVPFFTLAFHGSIQFNFIILELFILKMGLNGAHERFSHILSGISIYSKSFGLAGFHFPNIEFIESEH